jgi:hypothetical protein
MDRAGQVGCIACHQIGVHQTEVSLHHIDGRTKPGAHLRVIPLCGKHHQSGEGTGDFISVHPWKRRFEDAFGTQEELLAQVQQIVEEME